jgi:ribosome-associated protein
MSGPVRVRGSVVVPDAELRWRFSRSSGPGGQHVNTSETAAELSFDLAGSDALPEPYKARALERLSGRLVNGVITIRAEEFRSQLRNREAAKERLAALLAEATAPPRKPRRPTRPSRRAKERRLEDKRRRGEIKRGRSGRFGYGD